MPPTRDDPVDLQYNCHTASALASARSQALEPGPSGLVSTPRLAPVPPVTNLNPHLTATGTILFREGQTDLLLGFVVKLVLETSPEFQRGLGG